MWVRSQDKGYLINVNCFNQVNKKLYGYMNDITNEDMYWTLGVYDSPERIIEIMDEIEGHIKAGLIY